MSDLIVTPSATTTTHLHEDRVWEPGPRASSAGPPSVATTCAPSNTSRSGASIPTARTGAATVASDI